MSVSATNTQIYTNLSNTRYQWQSAKSNNNNSSSSTSSIAKSAQNLTGNGILNQISSMVELTRYAMQQMGLSSDSRVTFSQLNKYREEVSEKFDLALQNAMADLGVKNVNNLTFSLNNDGNISVQSSDLQDQKTAQAWFDSHTEIGQGLLKAIEEGGVSLPSDGSLKFKLGVDGSLQATQVQGQTNLQALEEDSANFADVLRNALAKQDFSIPDVLSFFFNSDGNIEVSDNTPNSDVINVWFAGQTQLAKELETLITKHELDTADLLFKVYNSGSLAISNIYESENDPESDLQGQLDDHPNIATMLFQALEEEGFLEQSETLDFVFDENGNLQLANADIDNAEEINSYLQSQADLANELKQIIANANIALNDVNLSLSANGLQASITGRQEDSVNLLEAVRTVLRNQSGTGNLILNSLNNLGIDPDINFSIQLQGDGKVKIVGTHTDINRIQKIFDDTPSLVKLYSQVEALAGLEDARKAMQLAPSAVRKSIQMESIAAAWWSNSENTTASYFGNYSNSTGLSLLSGLNLQV